jgi:hypothetical protein
LPYATTPLALRGSIAHNPKTKPETADMASQQRQPPDGRHCALRS